MKLINCAVYLALIAIAGFFSGRIMPKRWIKPEKGWFRSFAFEKNGTVYEKLGIRKWHKRLPDMSRILPFMMPAKNLSGDYGERLPVMIRETCVAETVHIAVSILGLLLLRIPFPGIRALCVNPEKAYKKIANPTPCRRTEVYLDVPAVFSAQGIKAAKTEMIGTAVRRLIEINTKKEDAQWRQDM